MLVHDFWPTLKAGEIDGYFWKRNNLVIGIDEAGWGPLAGPLYFGGVILNPERVPLGVNDSKKLTAKRRRELYGVIKGKAVIAETAAIPAAVFDKTSPAEAWYLGLYQILQQCLAHLTPHKQRIAVLLDGTRGLPEDSLLRREYNLEIYTAPKLDSLSLSVASASIIAKVEHDQQMEKLDRLHPEYGFASNSGYGTAKHLAALQQYGIIEGVHRRQYVETALTKMGGTHLEER